MADKDVEETAAVAEAPETAVPTPLISLITLETPTGEVCGPDGCY